MNRNWPTLIASARTLRVGCNLQIAIFENKINTSFSPSCDPKIKKRETIQPSVLLMVSNALHLIYKMHDSNFEQNRPFRKIVVQVRIFLVTSNASLQPPINQSNN